MNINYLFAQQNLIPNPSFEEYWECPIENELGNGEFTKCKYWWYPQPSNVGTPDYFNRCNNLTTFQYVGIPDNFWGHQEAFQGDGYVGLVPLEYSQNTNEILGMELISCKIIKQLKPCYEYNFTMRINLSNDATHSIQKMGILFTRDSVQFLSIENVYEQNPNWENATQIDDTINWTLLKGSFIAEGGEKFLTIGYFNDYNNSEWVFNDSTNINSFNTFAPYYYIDSVSLIEMEEVEDCIIILPNMFTPNGDGVNDVFSILEYGIENLVIYNRWGNKVATLSRDNPTWDGKCGDKDCSEGVYYYTANNKNISGIIHLVR